MTAPILTIRIPMRATSINKWSRMHWNERRQQATWYRQLSRYNGVPKHLGLHRCESPVGVVDTVAVRVYRQLTTCYGIRTAM